MCAESAIVSCRSCNPLDIQQLSFPGDLWFVLVNPVFEAPTAEMRSVLPKQVPMASAVHNSAMGGSLVGSLACCHCSLCAPAQAKDNTDLKQQDHTSLGRTRMPFRDADLSGCGWLTQQ